MQQPPSPSVQDLQRQIDSEVASVFPTREERLSLLRAQLQNPWPYEDYGAQYDFWSHQAKDDALPEDIKQAIALRLKEIADKAGQNFMTQPAQRTALADLLPEAEFNARPSQQIRRP